MFKSSAAWFLSINSIIDIMEHLSHLEKFTTPTWVTKDISLYIYNPYKELFDPHNWFSGAHLVDSEACSMLAFVLPALLHFRRKDRGDASRGKQPTNGKLGGMVSVSSKDGSNKTWGKCTKIL